MKRMMRAISAMVGGLIVMSSLSAYMSKSDLARIKRDCALPENDQVEVDKFFRKYPALYNMFTSKTKLGAVVGWFDPYKVERVDYTQRVLNELRNVSHYPDIDQLERDYFNPKTMYEAYVQISFLAEAYNIHSALAEELALGAIYNPEEHIFEEKPFTVRIQRDSDAAPYQAEMGRIAGIVSGFPRGSVSVSGNNLTISLESFKLPLVIMGSIFEWPTQPQVLSRAFMSEKARAVIAQLGREYNEVAVYAPKHYVYNDEIVLAEQVKGLSPVADASTLLGVIMEEFPNLPVESVLDQMRRVVGVGLWDIVSDDKNSLKNVFLGAHPQTGKSVIVFLDFEMPSVAGKPTDTDRTRKFPHMWRDVEKLALRKFDEFCAKHGLTPSASSAQSSSTVRIQ
jgi:hypothetical protein